MNNSEEYYKIPKNILDEILTQAKQKRDNWEFPNEMYIEADAWVQVVEHIITNSELI